MTQCCYQLYVDDFVIYFNILGELVIIALYCTNSQYSMFFFFCDFYSTFHCHFHQISNHGMCNSTYCMYT